MSRIKGRTIHGQTKRCPVTEWKWTRGSGEAQQIFLRGSYSNLRFNHAPGIAEIYDSIVIRHVSGEMYELIAAQSGDDISEIHDVDASNLTQNTLVNLRVKKQFTEAGVLEEEYVPIVVKIQGEVNKFRNGSQSYSAMTGAVSTIAGGRQCGFDLMDNLAKWGDQFLNAQYCYRHTIRIAERIFVGSNGLFGDIYANTHKIFTEEQLRSAENIPTGFALPQKVIDNSQPAQWLKQPSRNRYVVGQCREVVLEYLFADEWDEFKYTTQ